MKDKDSRRSKGVAFVLYIDRESAFKCVQSLNKTEVSGFDGSKLNCIKLISRLMLLYPVSSHDPSKKLEVLASQG